MAFNIKAKITVAYLMEALSSMYEQDFAVNKVHFIKRLFSLKMPKRSNFKEHLNEFNDGSVKFRSIKFDNEIQAC